MDERKLSAWYRPHFRLNGRECSRRMYRIIYQVLELQTFPKCMRFYFLFSFQHWILSTVLIFSKLNRKNNMPFYLYEEFFLQITPERLFCVKMCPQWKKQKQRRNRKEAFWFYNHCNLEKKRQDPEQAFPDPERLHLDPGSEQPRSRGKVSETSEVRPAGRSGAPGSPLHERGVCAARLRGGPWGPPAWCGNNLVSRWPVCPLKCRPLAQHSLREPSFVAQGTNEPLEGECVWTRRRVACGRQCPSHPPRATPKAASSGSLGRSNGKAHAPSSGMLPPLWSAAFVMRWISAHTERFPLNFITCSE